MTISKEKLVEYYQIQKLTTRQIAEKEHIGRSTIRMLLDKYQIPINNSKRETLDKTILTKEFLQKEYIEKGKSCKQISKEINISAPTISRALNKHNIEKRIGTRKGCKNEKVHVPKIDLSGKQHYDLKIIKYVQGGWLCECKCGQTKIYNTKRITGDNVRSCGCRRKINGNKHHFWKGYGEISESFYGSYYRKAVDRKIVYDVSIEYLWELFLKQDKKCSISKIPLNMLHKNRTASLDRIDSKQGYIEGNVQWVHKTINKIKWDLDQNEFIKWCKIVSENN